MSKEANINRRVLRVTDILTFEKGKCSLSEKAFLAMQVQARPALRRIGALLTFPDAFLQGYCVVVLSVFGGVDEGDAAHLGGGAFRAAPFYTPAHHPT
jgi:hypothetical protein